MVRHKRQRNSGFTLLEAIVALTLFATSGVAIYGLINSNLTSLIRVNDVVQQQQIIANLTAELKLIDLNNIQQGELEEGNYRVEWEATLVEEPLPNLSFGKHGDFVLALYDIKMNVYKTGMLLASYQTRQSTYQQKRAFRQ